MLELAEALAAQPFSALVGARITHIDDGQAVLDLDIAYDHRQRGDGALTPGPSSQGTHIFAKAERATKRAHVILQTLSGRMHSWPRVT